MHSGLLTFSLTHDSSPEEIGNINGGANIFVKFECRSTIPSEQGFSLNWAGTSIITIYISMQS